MNRTLIRCESAAQIATIANANHCPFTRSQYAAAVTLADVTYFWAAA